MSNNNKIIRNLKTQSTIRKFLDNNKKQSIKRKQLEEMKTRVKQQPSSQEKTSGRRKHRKNNNGVSSHPPMTRIDKPRRVNDKKHRRDKKKKDKMARHHISPKIEIRHVSSSSLEESVESDDQHILSSPRRNMFTVPMVIKSTSGVTVKLVSPVIITIKMH